MKEKLVDYYRRRITESTSYCAFQALAKNLNAMRAAGEMTDVVLVVEDRKFPAHKLILSAFSPFFKTMFSSEWVKSQQTLFTISSFKADAMETVLEYIYTGKLNLTRRNAPPTLQAAHLLQAPEMCKEIVLYLENNITKSNCLTILALADLYSCGSKLKERSINCILEHFFDLWAKNDFVRLNEKLLIEIIGHDYVRSETEGVILDAALKWLDFDKEKRMPVFPEVLRHVRWTLIPEEALKERLEKEGAYLLSAECKPVLEAALGPLSDAQPPGKKIRRDSEVKQRRAPAPGDTEGFVIFSSDAYGPQKMMLLSQFGQNEDLEERVLAAPPFSNISCGVCYKYNMYVASISVPISVDSADVESDGELVDSVDSASVYSDDSYDSLDSLDSPADSVFSVSIWRYESRSNSWEKLVTWENWTNVLGMSQIDGDVYVFGVQKNSEVSNKTMKLEGGTWGEVSPFLEVVKHPTVASFGGKIFIFGKQSMSDSYLLVQSYDPAKNSWDDDDVVPSGCGRFEACDFKDFIMLHPQCNKKYNNEVRLFDPSEPDSIDIYDSTDFFNVKLMVVNQKLIALDLSSGIVGDIREFCPHDHEWELCGQGKKKKAKHAYGPLYFPKSGPEVPTKVHDSFEEEHGSRCGGSDCDGFCD